MFIVDPPAQGDGVGRELLARAVEYGAGARGRIILSSRDSRAIGAYARLGLDLQPSVTALGAPRRVEAPAEVRAGRPADLPMTAAIDRVVRGAAHGEDLLAMLAGGSRLLVLEDRAYAVLLGGQLRLLAATDEDAAAAVLRGRAGPGRRRRREGGRGVDHRPSGLGRADLRGGRARALHERRAAVHGRRRGPLRALPPERCVSLNRYRSYE